MMARKAKENRDYAKEAAQALKDLNMAGAILALCESSLFSSKCHPFEAKISKLCHAEAQKCLRRYDLAMACIFEPDAPSYQRPESGDKDTEAERG